MNGETIMLMPDQVLQHLRKKISPEWKLAFFSSLVIGFLVHLYRLTNFLPNWDSIINFHTSQDTTFLGRCFLTYTCGISSYYDLPLVNGLLSLLYLSLGSVFITEIFQLHKKYVIVLFSGFFVTFPSVTSTLSYNFTADGYFLAMLLSVLAVFLTLKYRWGFLPGALCLCLSYGSYQAYITFAIMLIILWGIHSILFQSPEFKHFLRQMLRFLSMGILGTALYMLALQLILRLKDLNLLSYQGISEASVSLSNIKKAVFLCLLKFKQFFLGDLRPSLYTFLQCLLLIAAIGSILILARKAKLHQRPLYLFTIFCLTISIPFVAAIIYFTSPTLDYHTLMCAAYSLLILPSLFLLENINSEKLAACLSSWFITIVCGLSIFNNALIANIGYLYMNQSYEQTYGLVSHIAYRIHEYDFETPITQIGVIGYLNPEYIMLDLPPELTGITPSYLIDGQYGLREMLNTLFDFELTDAPDDIVIPFVHSPAYEQMDCWPASNSIVIDGNVLYIKISDVEW